RDVYARRQTVRLSREHVDGQRSCPGGRASEYGCRCGDDRYTGCHAQGARLRVISLWWRLVRFGFHLLYNQFAWTYDAVAFLVSAGEWHAWQRAAISALNLPSG